ncbi:helix-turn-helix domain-containing protein [Luteibacter aegosomatissinici]|uniref:helix-turn-helix domain-containing protein n=1 Tax=Luteibacter aegosomatissinici TaxID=2911539 RepID=UPI0031B8B05F
MPWQRTTFVAPGLPDASSDVGSSHPPHRDPLGAISIPPVLAHFNPLQRAPSRRQHQAERLAKARTLLVATSQCVGTISQRCGFSDQAYFTRLFKKSTGLTPLAFRAKFGCSRRI